ncbi:MAG: hypothetical protein N4J56_002852 [Chroococcidiopsis sp. SAG 2025]|uniref:hypothetical protein n=1 Tax=Chroococcidiopsis sp. SAG 2025 TaxID=171389 RepID=UPI002937082B|nr:hypothetical protein [Chroococcidiopsis sp. SAG 2025]MDV2993198.1 hypothetical protein [Chroococcidiopsis sp. SAG 2025]
MLADRKVDGTFDKLLELRTETAGTIADTFPEPGKFLPVCKSIRFEVVIAQQNTVANFAAGTNFWRFDLEVATTLNGTYTPVASWTPTTGTPAKTRLIVNSANVTSIMPLAAYVRVRAIRTVAATDPVDYYAFVAKPLV